MNLIIGDRLKEFEVNMPQRGGVVAWSPPAPNWNPWTGMNIDEGPLSYTPLADISRLVYALGGLQDTVKIEQNYSTVERARERVRERASERVSASKRASIAGCAEQANIPISRDSESQPLVMK